MTTVAQLGEHLKALGWSEHSVTFGRQSWTVQTAEGSAFAEVHVEGDGIVGSFTLIVSHPGDDGEEPWEESVVELKVGPVQDRGISVHRPEFVVVATLTNYAEILAATVET